MSDTTTSNYKSADYWLAEVEIGARTPCGWQYWVVFSLSVTWSLYQLFIATSMPFYMAELTGLNFFTDLLAHTRRIHLLFAMALAAMVYPMLRISPRNYIPTYDFLLVGLSAIVCLYAVVFHEQLADRSGAFTINDTIIGILGLIVLSVTVYRSLGLPLLIVALIFIIYVFYGSSFWVPEVIRWKGASLGKTVWHYWIQDEGVFGQPLDIAATMIFLFVLFGSILEKAGGGNYFIQLSFSLLGHLRGGPAKAAVISSALSGIYSGSSIANTVTTGTFTIPLMKKTGLSAEKAGAIEVASSTNGQLTPPVMGAAAFLMAESTGVPYIELLKNAFLPAVVSYVALIYIVHLEALKLGLKGLKPSVSSSAAARLLYVVNGVVITISLLTAVYYLLNFVSYFFPNLTFSTVILVCVAAYLILIAISSRLPDLTVNDPNASLITLPKASDVIITGLYYILPIIVLIWCIVPTPNRLSPALAASWACFGVIFISLTQHPLKALFRNERDRIKNSFQRGLSECLDGMVSGARAMISISVATAAAGVIVGSLSLSGAHNILLELIEILAGGNLIILLLLIAIVSLILGMGLPTTANYIVVSTLMAPIIVTLGAKNGLVIPLVAAHLFVFYFGILADDTPPVGLAAFAAAAISGGDPIKTGVQGFMYDIRTAVLPFLFIFNTELLLINVSPEKAIFIFSLATIAMMLFAAVTQGYFFAKNYIWESIMLLLVAFTLMRPGYWLDQLIPEYNEHNRIDVLKILEKKPTSSKLQLKVSGPNLNNPNKLDETILQLQVDNRKNGFEQLADAGLSFVIENAKVNLEEPSFGSKFENKLSIFDFYDERPVYIVSVAESNKRFSKEFFYIPAIFVLGTIIFLQRQRQTQPAF
ncbi:MAG: hypothetical protein TECD_00326 [Hyphomicrobiaceae bacterium hypho_1]